jgi:light-regulated signal transduction histidine kinase (bacteriophytochrome)
VVMTVKDRGCGMDQAAVLRLMQAGGGVSSANGRGVGFRVVRELAAVSGGVLSIESEPGAGTSVSVEWGAMRQAAALEQQDVEQQEVLEMEGTRMNDSGVKMVVRGEAGWIAC